MIQIPLFTQLSAAIVSLLLLNSCSSSRHLPDELRPSRDSDNVQTLVIMGLNDLHGALAPIESVTREPEGTKGVPYQRGGASILATHIRHLRQEFGKNFLVIDAGDEFQGSIESNTTEGKPVVDFFNHIGLTAATIGNHEFDFGPVGTPDNLREFRKLKQDPLGALKERLKEARYPYTAANTLDRITKRPVELPNTTPSKTLNIGDLKIGIIGLTTLDTPVTTRPEFVEGLVFAPLVETTIQESQKLRKSGAEVILVSAHVGAKCDSDGPPASPRFWKPSDPQGNCNPKEELTRYMNELPPGTVDAVVSGHSHQVIHHWIKGIPVIQSGTRGLVYNLLYLHYDRKERKILTDRTRIEGPIPVCEKVFENQNDCNGDRSAPPEGRGSLVTPVVHGVEIYPDPSTEALLRPVFAQTAALKNRVLAEAKEEIIHSRTRESPLGNFIADAIREATQSDFAIVNPGGIRAPIESGPITYEELFRVLPFDNYVSKLKLTGKELKLFVQIAYSGARGYFPTSGLQVKIFDLKHPGTPKDLNRDGRVEHWEYDRLVDLKTQSGKVIRDQDTYTVATIDFLVSGGDDFGWFMSQIPGARIEHTAGGLIRDVVEQRLLEWKFIPGEFLPLVNTAQPRIVATAPQGGKKVMRKRRKR